MKAPGWYWAFVAVVAAALVVFSVWWFGRVAECAEQGGQIVWTTCVDREAVL